jgi:DNA-binding phage protein
LGAVQSKQEKTGGKMPVTRSFRSTVMERASRDPKFRQQMLTEAVNELLDGGLQAGKALLRDYINSTISFERLAKGLKKSSKSIHRMLGPRGNPRAESIFGIIRILQDHERVQLQVKARKPAA